MPYRRAFRQTAMPSKNDIVPLHGSIDLHIGMLAFRLTLSNPVGGVILGSRAECRVLIVPGSKLKHKV